MKLRIILSLLCGLCLTLFVSSASASLSFPEALRKKLELEEIAGPAPGCQVCHKDDDGGVKTATKPLGRALSVAGAMGANVPSLLSALNALDTQRTDSDRDGAPDIDELRAGTDPNIAMTVDGNDIPMAEIPLAQTGCAVARSPQSPHAMLLSLALVLALIARRSSANPACRARAACRRAR